MTDPHDETRPLPPAAAEPPQAHPAGPEDATAPIQPPRPGAIADVPTWINTADQPDAAVPAARADAGASGGNRPPGGVPGERDVAGTPGPTPGGRRWSGRTTAVVVAAALGIGALGAAGAAAAVTRSDSQVREDVGGRGQLPGGGQGRLPGGGVAPDGGRGGLPGGPPPGGVDHDGDGDRHGTADGDGGAGQRRPGPGDGTGSSDPGDANGADAALDT